MNQNDVIRSSIEASIQAKKTLNIELISQAATAFIQTYQTGNKVMLAGNGGSATDAQHIAAEMVGRFMKDRRALPALSFAENISSLTAIGNDYGYENVFSRQLEAFAQSGDLFIGLSTSGNSENVIRALQVAKEKGLRTIGFTGKDGGKMGKLVDIHLNVQSSDTARIQESHILMGHILCDLLEKTLFPDQ